ncbi:hypothetical protein SAMN05428642_102997 [Flaviramulus basaltis]|uniref:Uncharacterized protein n=1 Tax=Flaviramulus basaltis TaxID=369401 RepID=A0A1K2IM98_9FLAO|nr:hypothetical protein SAMN05428642_102997 [Flaviramulus basaltis]
MLILLYRKIIFGKVYEIDIELTEITMDLTKYTIDRILMLKD